MQNWGLLIVVIVVISAGLPALMQQGRSDVGKTLWLAALYLAYIALGIALFFWLIPKQGTGGDGAYRALALTLAMLGWILYGTLILVRLVPRYQEPPAWLMRFGIADVVLIVLTALCVGVFLWS